MRRDRQAVRPHPRLRRVDRRINDEPVHGNLIPAYVVAFGKNFVVLVTWIADNWKDIFATVWSYLKAGFMNTLENIKSFWTGLWSFINGKGFNVEWKGLTDGAVNEMKKMPEFVKAATDPAWDKMQQEAIQKINKQGEAFDSVWEKHRPTSEKKAVAKAAAKSEIGQIIQDGLAPVKNLKEKSKGGKSTMSGVLDIWKSAQQNLIKSTEKEHLATSKGLLAEQKKTNAHLVKLTGRQAAGGIKLSRN